jgi:gas vesicle protein
MSIPFSDIDTSASSTTDAAKEQATGLASKVQEQGSVAADSLQQSGQQIAGEAKVQVGKLNEEVQRQFHSVLEQAQSELSGRATEQTDKAATNLRSLASAFHALADAGFATARLVRGAQKSSDIAGQSDFAISNSLPLAESPSLSAANDLEADGYGAVAGAGPVVS